MVRYAKLPLSLDTGSTRGELLAMGGEWLPHMNTFHYTGAWDVLPLRSPGGDNTSPVPDLMGKAEYADTSYMDNFPSVKKLLSSLACPVMSVRFLNLKAGAIIKEHRDAELALEQGEARLHFPVVTHPDVEFYCEDERIVLNESECWYLNANLLHRVSNNSPIDRIHLVIDCKANDWLTNLVASAAVMATRKEIIDPNLLAAIKHWRQENTPESNRRAEILEAMVNKLMANE